MDFLWKNTLKRENRGFREAPIMMFTKLLGIKVLLNMEYLRKFNWMKQNFEHAWKKTDRSKTEKIIAKLKRLFRMKPALKDIKVGLHLEPGHPPKKKKPQQNYATRRIAIEKKYSTPDI